MKQETKLTVLRDYLERELFEVRADYNYYKGRAKTKEQNNLCYGLYCSINALENALEMVQDLMVK